VQFGSVDLLLPYNIRSLKEGTHEVASIQAGRWCLRMQEIVYSNKLRNINGIVPVRMDALSKARTAFNRSNTGIVISNPARGMDVCPRFSVFCCPV
jgi:hypothetical protein